MTLEIIFFFLGIALGIISEMMYLQRKNVSITRKLIREQRYVNALDTFLEWTNQDNIRKGIGSVFERWLNEKIVENGEDRGARLYKKNLKI